VSERRTPRLHVLEAAPLTFLILLCLGLTVESASIMRFLDATATSLHDPQAYIDTVLSRRP
jgi:multicomponent K+:H+ antiporter subunit D